jgi:hypothetical protein
MSKLRRWQIAPGHPYSLTLAADARLRPTSYTDDQVWVLSPGEVDSPALALQTRYGGRAGLVSLVPMWTLEGRTVYQAQAYARQPFVTHIAPGYLRARAQIVPQLALQAEFWAVSSQIIGGRYLLGNSGNTPLTIRFDLFGHVGIDGKEMLPQIVNLDTKTQALHLGRVGNINPAVMVANSQITADAGSKIGTTVTIQPKSQAIILWVHAGLHSVYESLKTAQELLSKDWQPHLKKVVEAAAAIPIIETGDDDLDLTIAFAYRELLQAYLRPTASLPHASFVAARQPDRGWSRRGDGTDHIRAWSGQALPLAYQTALATAAVNPELAQGVVRNFVAVQQRDGWIDWKPGLSGQRAGMMALPLLARLAWGIFQYTEDTAFLRDVFPALLRAFERWFESDLDSDGDGLPEWQEEQQTGYVATPVFAVGFPWGQHLDIRTVEAPDLTAYLLSEAISLRAIAYFLRDETNESKLSEQVAKLQAALTQLWREDRFVYRDRDTHETTQSVIVLENGAGDEEHFPALDLSPPSRLIVEILGGTGQTPNIDLHLEGVGADGEPIHETVDGKAFTWTHGRGVYTSQHVFAQINRIHCDGLIRLYRIRARTPNFHRLDISAVLPLWAVNIEEAQIQEIIELLSDSAHFWRPSGIPMCSAQDDEFDPTNADGSGGVWTFWQTLLGEGLIEAGRIDLATDLARRLLQTQMNVLKENKEFSEFYHSDEPQGLGEGGNLAGIVPLHLLLRTIGVRIISANKVWTGGRFHWDNPITVTQHDVVIRRSAAGTQIRFPSGRSANLPSDAPWQEVSDTQQTPQPTRPTPPDAG